MENGYNNNVAVYRLYETEWIWFSLSNSQKCNFEYQDRGKKRETSILIFLNLNLILFLVYMSGCFSLFFVVCVRACMPNVRHIVSMAELYNILPFILYWLHCKYFQYFFFSILYFLLGSLSNIFPHFVFIRNKNSFVACYPAIKPQSKYKYRNQLKWHTNISNWCER